MKTMKKWELAKITMDTNLWKKGQKVWILFFTGACASFAIGKYKGGGRWIKGWIKYVDNHHPYKYGSQSRPNAKYIGTVSIKKEFYDYLEKLSF